MRAARKPRKARKANKATKKAIRKLARKERPKEAVTRVVSTNYWENILNTQILQQARGLKTHSHSIQKTT